MMIEPTESESKEELDRFCDAMISIHAEIQAIETGKVDKRTTSSKTRRTPREAVVSDKWDRPYSREQAAFPAPWTARAQVLASRRPHRQRLRRPQSRLLVRRHGSLPELTGETAIKRNGDGPSPLLELKRVNQNWRLESRQNRQVWKPALRRAGILRLPVHGTFQSRVPFPHPVKAAVAMLPRIF